METYKKYKQKADEYFEKYRLYLALFLSVFVIFSGTVLIIQGANAGKGATKTIKSEDFNQENNKAIKQEDKVETKEIIFDIEGAVVAPGVYKLAAGSVLIDAINKAGGFSIDADRERIAREINQASLVGDGSKIYIFKKSDKNVKIVSIGPNQNYSGVLNTDSSNSNLSQQQNSAKINLNTAFLTELDTLPGIGPALAQRIIDWRETNGGFEVVEDIKKVKGIGDSVFEGLKNQITIE